MTRLPVTFRLVARWIGDVPHRSFTAGVAVCIEVAIILTIAGFLHGLRANPTFARLQLTLYTNLLLFFVCGVGFIFLSIERYLCTIERTQEFGLLKVLGAPFSYFSLLLISETLAICVPGTTAGIGLMFLTRLGVSRAFPRFLQLDVVCIWWIFALGIVVIGSLAGAGIGARKAIKDGIVQAMSYEK